MLCRTELAIEVRMKMKNYSYYAVFVFDKVIPGAINIEFPDLPGCLSCAYSYSEAKKNAREALSLYLDGMRISDVPKPSYKESMNVKDIAVEKITVKMKEEEGKLIGRGIERRKSNLE